MTLTNVNLSRARDYFKVGKPFVPFLPTYLEAGNGVDNGTSKSNESLGDFLAYEHNYAHCFGAA